MMTVSNSQLQQMARVLTETPGVEAAYLLGSGARGTMRPGSDLDIAVLPKAGTHLSIESCILLATALGEVVHRDVDIGVLDTRNLVYAKEAILTGSCFYVHTPAVHDEFAAHALSLYVQLRRERREVENAYRTR
jgi:predicted nucleotidyltransferase